MTAINTLDSIQARLDKSTSDPKWLNDELALLRDEIEAELAAASPVTPTVPKVHFEAGFVVGKHKVCGPAGPRVVFGVDQNGKRTSATVWPGCREARCQMWSGSDCALKDPHKNLIDLALAQMAQADEGGTP